MKDFERAVIDTREVRPGDLFVGLRGENTDGGRFAADALKAGAAGVLVAPEHAQGLEGGTVITAEDPLAALQEMARDWRRIQKTIHVSTPAATSEMAAKARMRATPSSPPTVRWRMTPTAIDTPAAAATPSHVARAMSNRSILRR